VGEEPPADHVELMGALMPFARNSEIYGENEPADYLYKVVSGTVRTYKVLLDGRRQIGAFHQPGDVFGFETGDAHTFSAEAITDCRIAVIKRSALLALAARDNDVARQMWAFTARELQRVQAHMLLLIKSAQETGVLQLALSLDRTETRHPAAARHRTEHAAEIDHRDRVRDNNRLDNLRLATRVQNSMNQWTGKKNTSGFKGISFAKKKGKGKTPRFASCNPPGSTRPGVPPVDAAADGSELQPHGRSAVQAQRGGCVRARGQSAARDDRPLDRQRDEADEVVAHVVERVAARRPGAAPLAAEIHGEHLELFVQKRDGFLESPPRLGLARDEQQGGIRPEA
jgi:CRP-like cAMP-binding protein